MMKKYISFPLIVCLVLLVLGLIFGISVHRHASSLLEDNIPAARSLSANSQAIGNEAISKDVSDAQSDSSLDDTNPNLQKAYLQFVSNPLEKGGGHSFINPAANQELPPLKESDQRVSISILSRQAIEINWDMLNQLREEGKGVIRIDVGNEAPLALQVRSTTANPGGGYSLSGDIDGYPLGQFSATAHGDALIADIRTGDKRGGDFSIRLNPTGTHELRKVDRTVLPVCDGAVAAPLQGINTVGIGNPSVVPRQQFRGKRQPAGEITESADRMLLPSEPKAIHEPLVEGRGVPISAQDDGSVIDVMIVYTAAARTKLGGTNGTVAAINQAINEANQAFSASNVNTSFRLAHQTEVTYTESGSSQTDLNRVKSKTDGIMDNVHTLRNTYAADIVSLWEDGDFAGIGSLMQTLSNSFESSAFNVCDVDAAVSNYTFAHECGHNMGCHHEAANAPDPTLYPYSYGWSWTGNSGTQYRSIMAYNFGARVPRFSNPSVNYDGVATGNAASANNARSINNARVTVSSWRTAPATTLSSIAITGGANSWNENSYQDFTATATYSNGTTQNVTSSATWSVTSGPIIMDSSLKGRVHGQPVTGNQSGNFSVSYSAGGITRTATKNVTIVDQTPAVTLSSLAIGGGANSWNENSYQDFTATATYSNGATQNVTSSATWSVTSGPIIMDSSLKGRVHGQSVTSNQSGSFSVSFTSGGISRSASKNVSIINQGGSPLADALNAPGQSFVSSGDASWSSQTLITHDGVSSAQIGGMTDNQSASLSTTVSGPMTVSFWWKVSSEANYDYLRVYLDGVQQGTGISGEVGWEQRSFTVPAGTHLLHWSYEKDGSVSAGLDAGWVDQVLLTSTGNSGGAGKLLWSHTGGGVSLWNLDASNNFTGVYTNFGPFTGWTAVSHQRITDGSGRLLWTHTGGGVSLWKLDANDNATGAYTNFGPFSGWTSNSYHRNADGSGRLLWTHTGGGVSLWKLDVNDNHTGAYTNFGPFTGWTAASYHRGADGSGRLLWTHTGGGVSLWKLDANDNATGAYTNFGPFTGWTATDYHRNADGSGQLLWNHTGNGVSLWSLDANDNFTGMYTNFGPFSGWTAKSYFR